MLRFRAHSLAASQGPGLRGSGEGRQSRHSSPRPSPSPASHFSIVFLLAVRELASVAADTPVGSMVQSYPDVSRARFRVHAGESRPVDPMLPGALDKAAVNAVPEVAPLDVECPLRSVARAGSDTAYAFMGHGIAVARESRGPSS